MTPRTGGNVRASDSCAQFDYDDYGQLWRQWQEVDGKVNRQGKTKALRHARGGGQNRHRLKELFYEYRRLERYGYGENGTLNDRLNRVEGLRARMEGFDAAQYDYLGLATVVRKILPQPNLALDLIGDTRANTRGSIALAARWTGTGKAPTGRETPWRGPGIPTAWTACD